MKFGIGAILCLIFLGACTIYLTKKPEPQDCYFIDELTEKQRASLYVEDGNPTLLIGSNKVICPCYQNIPLVGVGESEKVIGSSEGDEIIGFGEDNEDIIGLSEDEGITGTGENDEDIIGRDEGEYITGTGENDEDIVGRDEGEDITGIGEDEDDIIGYGEGEDITGIGEDEKFFSDFSKLSCLVTPTCSGFQLIGYQPKQITIITEMGQRKVVSTDCITW